MFSATCCCGLNYLLLLFYLCYHRTLHMQRMLTACDLDRFLEVQLLTGGWTETTCWRCCTERNKSCCIRLLLCVAFMQPNNGDELCLIGDSQISSYCSHQEKCYCSLWLLLEYVQVSKVSGVDDGTCAAGCKRGLALEPKIDVRKLIYLDISRSRRYN